MSKLTLNVDAELLRNLDEVAEALGSSREAVAADLLGVAVGRENRLPSSAPETEADDEPQDILGFGDEED